MLARAGHDVVLLERDATPLPNSADDAFDWQRRGAPQVRHSHAFLARGRNLLRDHLPDVREKLLEAGVTEVAWGDFKGEQIDDPSPRPGDEDLVMLACRRTTFEWVLRRAALDTARVDLRDGVTVEGLKTNDSGGVPRVTGLTTSLGDIDADMVIDATGRPSRLVEMLRDHGVGVREKKSGTGIVYLSRFYRLREDTSEPNRFPFNGGELGYMKFAVFQGDNRTFSVTLAYGTDDADMANLREPGLFDKATTLIPAINEWTTSDVSEPISKVHYMGGLINRMRWFVEDGEPVVLGLHAIGDSSVCTNPLYGRGCSLGLVHGALLTDTLAEHGDNPKQLAVAFDQATQEQLVPWYIAAVAQDKVSMKVQRGEELSEFDNYMRSIVLEGVLPAVRVDATVSRAWMRSFNLLTTPEALLSDGDILQRVMKVWNERDEREPEAPLGPNREEFLQAIAS